MESIEALFQAVRIRNVPLRNRFVMSPMTRCFSPAGVPGQDVADYYRRRAEGGVGLIITEGVGVDHPSAIGSGSMGEQNVPVMYGEQALAGWQRVVAAVHAAGGVIFPQLWHMGVIRVEGTGPVPGARSLRPSGLWGTPGQTSMSPEYLERMLPPTEPMSESDIADVIAAYGRSAAHAKAAGFDGIAIHGAHGYLIDTFFWHDTNRRADQYGGDIEARARFGAEVVKAIRTAVGPNLPILFRFSQWKLQDYQARIAATPRELEQLLGPLADAGVDVFDASTRIFTTPAFAGSDLTLAGWTRKLTGKMSMAVGGIGLNKDLQSSFEGGTEPVNNLDQVLARFSKQEFDLVGVGRSLLMDPAWTQKARTGSPFLPFRVEAYRELV